MPKNLASTSSLNPQGLPSENFDLTDWSLQLPVNSHGEPSGTAAQIYNLTDYQNSDYFFTADRGAMVFVAPVVGATTSGSDYTRSELREMTGSQKAAWTVNQGGALDAELKVMSVPSLSDGASGDLIVAQVHGQSHELCRLYYGGNTIYFVDDHGGPNGTPASFTLQDAGGHQPNISFGELFGYSIHVDRHQMTVDVMADHTRYKAVDPIAPAWSGDQFYFKAGAYNNVAPAGSSASHVGSGNGVAAFYELQVSHP